MDQEQKTVSLGELHGPRPLSLSDTLAQGFPADLFKPNELIGQLFPRTTYRGFQNLSSISKADPSEIIDEEDAQRVEFYGWHPEVKKYNDRWLIEINPSLNLRFGIDALRIGFNNTVDFGNNIFLLPYIHFKDPKSLPIPTGYEGIENYGVYQADLILLKRWQIDELKSIVKSIE